VWDFAVGVGYSGSVGSSVGWAQMGGDGADWSGRIASLFIGLFCIVTGSFWPFKRSAQLKHVYEFKGSELFIVDCVHIVIKFHCLLKL